MPEHHEEATQNESSTKTKEEADGKHSLVRALICTGHEIEFSLQNSLTIAGVVVVPLAAAVITALGFDAPLPPAVAFGLLVPLWFLVLRTRKYARSRTALYSSGIVCSAFLLLAGFEIALSMKPKSTHDATPPPYSVTAGTTVGGIALWMVDNQKTSKCPVPLAVYINVVNLHKKCRC